VVLQSGPRAADTPVVNVDPFDLLGVGRDATAAEINAAYRRLAPVFDPRRWNERLDTTSAARSDEAVELVAEARAWSEALVRAREAALDVALLRSAAVPGAPNRPGRLLVAVEGPTS
jgi:hypothetical protein